MLVGTRAMFQKGAVGRGAISIWNWRDMVGEEESRERGIRFVGFRWMDEYRREVCAHIHTHKHTHTHSLSLSLSLSTSTHSSEVSYRVPRKGHRVERKVVRNLFVLYLFHQKKKSIIGIYREFLFVQIIYMQKGGVFSSRKIVQVGFGMKDVK